ncbi:MAG: 16S rRNA (adenine(1518)-N(6)/adenine(1519)-N(6))-dimethyltransferase, partial [Clostridia bacterium]|nr:16S rRNA (adenine(1518)-N(6)/adenine(1519)-N(6))-dimethyltransferase [Clostridia bacterium]
MGKIVAKKSLGQNFLQDDSVIERIVEMSGVNSDTDVLEI